MALSFASDRLLVPGSVVTRAVSGTTVLLNTETGRYFTLDEIGTRAWTLLISQPSLQTVFDTLLGEYDVAPDQLRADLESLVARLGDQGLVEIQRG